MRRLVHSGCEQGLRSHRDSGQAEVSPQPRGCVTVEMSAGRAGSAGKSSSGSGGSSRRCMYCLAARRGGNRRFRLDWTRDSMRHAGTADRRCAGRGCVRGPHHRCWPVREHVLDRALEIAGRRGAWLTPAALWTLAGGTDWSRSAVPPPASPAVDLANRASVHSDDAA